MTEVKTPEVETPEIVTEFVSVIPWGYVALAVILGVAVGVTFAVLFIRIEDAESSDA